MTDGGDAEEARAGAGEYVIIVGAMKSGTTTLFDLLAQHPAIAPSRVKEPGFFALDEAWRRGWDWYAGLFDFDPARHRYRLEGSTDYSKAPFVDADPWTRMRARRDVSVRLLYIMRDPVRRLESHARHVQNNRREIGRRVSPRPDHGLDAGLSPVSLAISDYASQLDAYAEARAQGRLLLMTLEDLRADPEAEMARVHAFLGLAPHPLREPETPRNAASAKRRIPKRLSAVMGLRPVSAAGRILLPAALREGIKARLVRPRRVAGRFAFTEAEEVALRGLFAPGLERLRRDHGVEMRPRPPARAE